MNHSIHFKLFVCTQSNKLSIRPYQVLPLWARANLRAMAMKEYSVFPKAPALQQPHPQIVSCHIWDTPGSGSYPSAEMQLVYSTAPADWTKL